MSVLLTEREGNHPDVGILLCFFRYFYQLLSTPEVQGESDPGRGTSCADVYGLGITEPFQTVTLASCLVEQILKRIL